MTALSRRTLPGNLMRRLGFALALLVAAPAFADSLSDAQRLLRAGQHEQALAQVDRLLASQPKDANGRFLKGIILTEMNRAADAITIFTGLTEDNPELPEPYNNLAVLYAQQKQFERARGLLETAIRANPNYAVAYENLGDLYAKQAKQAYDKALQLAPSSPSSRAKAEQMQQALSVRR